MRREEEYEWCLGFCNGWGILLYRLVARGCLGGCVNVVFIQITCRIHVINAALLLENIVYHPSNNPDRNGSLRYSALEFSVKGRRVDT